MTSPLLTRARREVTLLEAVLNVTTPCDRWLMFLDLGRVDPVGFGWYDNGAIVARIRSEFHRLRRKKGRAE